MALRQFGAAAATAVTLAFAASPASAVTEIQWWHAMTGPNNDVVVKLANDFNASQSDYKIVPAFKGSYADVLNAGIAAFRAGNAPGIMQVFEVGTATMMAAKGAIYPVHELMKDGGVPFDPSSYLPAVSGYFSDVKGNMLSFPFNSSTPILYYNKDLFKKAGLDPETPPKTFSDVEAYAKKLQAAGVPCETIREVHDQPYRAIIDAAQALGCDLIVMASHGRRGISALLLGSETVKVLTHSTIPVLVYR